MTAVALEPNPSEQIATLRRLGALGDTYADFARIVDLHDEESAFDRLLAFGSFLGNSHDTMRWWIADYLVFSESALGDRFYQLAETLGLQPTTLMQYSRVGRLVPKGVRRSTLRFSHHRAVCALEPAERDRWLNRAEREALSAADLEELLRHARNGHEPERSEPVVQASVVPARVVEAARDALKSATKAPGGFFVPAEPFAKLRAALGEA